MASFWQHRDKRYYTKASIRGGHYVRRCCLFKAKHLKQVSTHLLTTSIRPSILGMRIGAHFQSSTLKFKRILPEIVGECEISIQRNIKWDGVHLKHWVQGNRGDDRCKWV